MTLHVVALGVLCLAFLGATDDEATSGTPPFMMLSPPNFQAGHNTSLKLMLLTEQTGNVSLKYYNYTRTYGYSTGTYDETVLKEFTISITAEDKIIDIPIEVPEFIYGTHVIDLNGYMVNFGTFHMVEKKPISVNYDGYKTYVQTDKPIYKPGQPVRFRGFSVDSSLKGLMLTEGISVKIRNPDGVEVLNDDIRNDEGIIHNGIFMLAEEAKVGTYRIEVDGKSSSASCSFSVEEYVLPKFGVEIEGPGQIGVEDKVVRGKISATYTYGKPLNGKVTLKFAVDNKSQRSYSGPYLFREITSDLVEGTADWEVDITDLAEKKLKYLFNPWCTPSVLVVSAVVVDENGGYFVEKEDSTTKFSQSSMKLEFNQNTQRNYAAGFPYFVEIDVEALTIDEVENMPVKITIISGLSDLKYETRNVYVNNGKAFATFNISEEACAVKVTAEMEIDSACDTVFACFQPERMVSKSDEFVRFYKKEYSSYHGGDNATYSILANNELEILHFMILSKGNIVKSWELTPSWTKDEHGKFVVENTITIPHDIVTRSRLLVLSANKVTGYILADAIDICIVEKLPHNLNLSFTEKTAKPGQNITVALVSDPRSFVGISVNDASLNLLRKPCKVLTQDSTLEFLRGLDDGKFKDLSCELDDPYQCKSNTEVKTVHINDLLESEGVDLDTNMNRYNYIPEKSSPYYSTKYKSSGRGGSRMYNLNVVEYDSMIDNAGDNVADGDIGTVEETVPRKRTFFPESWLWTDTMSDEMGNTKLYVAAPDTITAWTGSAFGLSPENGLGFSNEVQFKTFLTFFISLDLPYSGTVGEIITVPARIFNYNDIDITAKVLISSNLWETVTKTVSVVANKATTVNYTIRLTAAGSYGITVVASSSTGESDSIEKSLLIKPGGEKIIDTTGVLIMERDRMGNKSVLSVSLPENFIPGSHSLKLVAVGDILGEAASGISNLIQLPSGCGEQNMHKIAINVFSANYLRSLYKELPENIDYNIKHNLNIGLQQQLAYRKGTTSYSNGYSIFKDGPTSDWLTAFVHRIVKQFPKDVFVPCDSAMSSDSSFLMTKIQSASWGVTKSEVDRDGWAPYQYSAHKDKQLYWQSYFIISLLEEDEPSRCGNRNTLKYNSDRITRVCYSTFEMANRSQSDDCCYHHMVAYSVELCKQRGFLNHTEDSSSPFADDETCLGATRNVHYKFVECGENLEHESVRASSKAIEASGYAAIYLMSKGNVDDALPLIMWLASQRNENGGFRSSQDTVIGLQALSRFATLTNFEMAGFSNLTIVIGKGNTYFERIKINEENKLVTKEVLLAPVLGDYKIKWTGVGVAFVQLISKYHIDEKEYDPIYMLEGSVIELEGIPTVRVSFTLPNSSSTTMFLLEVVTPTGFEFTKSLIEGRMQLTEGGFSSITRYDITEGGQRLQLYVDPDALTMNIELNLPLYSKFTVVDRMPAQISLVDYYHPSLRQTIFYSIEGSDNSNGENIDDGSGVFNATEGACDLQLSCDILGSAEAIVHGVLDYVTGDMLNIKEAFAYKACRGGFQLQYNFAVKFSQRSLNECVPKFQKQKTLFLVRYVENNRMEVVGMANYDSVKKKTEECFSELTQCPTSNK